MKNKAIIAISAILLISILLSCKGLPGAAGTEGAEGPAGTNTSLMMFQDGLYPSNAYSGTSDTDILGSLPENNYGSAQGMDANNADCSLSRTLIRFNLSGLVPGNVEVTKAYLRLNINDGASPIAFNVYELTAPFTEGVLNGATGAASWNSRTAAATWTTPGGDYNASPIAAVNITATSVPDYIELELSPSVIQKWIGSDAQNFGMIIISSPEGSGGGCKGAEFASSDDGSAAMRPKLTVHYTLP